MDLLLRVRMRYESALLGHASSVIGGRRNRLEDYASKGTPLVGDAVRSRRMPILTPCPRSTIRLMAVVDIIKSIKARENPSFH